ncbi:threonyl-tRNA synthetase [Heterostelium album PN500]|uniref:threonine--tRNA ligase n=1 Tax=Heterostelium pallidum (strain ATCC 26659 / Pp 5 / PN500) TaxID=670386 RepID=D3AY33_HETP5|nr:threonyl-tRNA synthetase [Heterostelium album PN500]EFA85860.1 threonyl-tRNA synthetase [Heterostelium album PN500]|eukprot:XP_020437966.1 threonyl-tRNA synthetase [Heterostelium album PN500]
MNYQLSRSSSRLLLISNSVRFNHSRSYLSLNYNSINNSININNNIRCQTNYRSTPLLTSSLTNKVVTTTTSQRFYCGNSGDSDTIDIILPDGRKINGQKGVSTPFSVARTISKSLANRVLLSRVNGKLHGIGEALNERESNVELLDFENDDARRCFWLSSSIVTAAAAMQHFGSNSFITHHNYLLTNNALQDGYQVDMYLPENRTITESDIKSIQKIMTTLIQSDKPFTRKSITKKQSLEIFKVYIINNNFKNDGDIVEIVEFNGFITLVDKIPTLMSSGKLKCIELTKNSSIVGSLAALPTLQRLSGISFPEKEQLAVWKDLQHQAAQLDHRNIGRDQELFFFHPYSPGSCFFLPHGTRIYNKLHSFLRSEYRKRGFEEVITPNIYSQKLWETSGHWQNYKDNMFGFQCDHTSYSLKPMNCPGHCLMFAHKSHSYKDLPMRIADFGVLHRNETHGSLTGLTRVRRFQQDDAHIFCRADQIREEIQKCLEFMQFVYDKFGFSFSLELSTRPTPFLGDVDMWNRAEASLESVLNEFGREWRVNPGDGAFYGPKIDIHIKDANGKSHQCATIQLDFQLPIRFGLEYTAADSRAERPVMIHRAIFGSTERMMAILIEHTKGKWPLWLSPRQIFIAPVSVNSDGSGGPYNDYLNAVKQRLFDAGYHIDSDLSDKTINKKLREAITLRYNYLVVIGKEEQDNNTITIRRRDSTDQITLTLDKFLEELNDNIINFK